jgi:hypothetical protein
MWLARSQFDKALFFIRRTFSVSTSLYSMQNMIAINTNPCDPCINVIQSCEAVLSLASQTKRESLSSTSGPSVVIDEAAIEHFADDFATKDLNEMRRKFEWDECDWHFTPSLAPGPLTAQYIFVMDSLNYCFWPTPGFEYEQLATSLRDVLITDPTAFDGEKLKNMNETTLQSWFPTHALPNISSRVQRLRELGYVLCADYDGSAANFAASANGSAVKLVSLIIEKFPGFRDTVIYRGLLVHFYKRAQILTSDLWAAYGRRVDYDDDNQNCDGVSADANSSDKHFAVFRDINQLTMFADYRVPQILRHIGILKYSSPLQQHIDGLQEIAFASEWETEIRAGTVIAVDKIRSALARRNVDVLSVEVDWMLWNEGEKMQLEMAAAAETAGRTDSKSESQSNFIKPHHRTLTIYY